jgi:serine/threonine protein kinase
MATSMQTFDLSPYGINLTLKKGMKVEDEIYPSRISKGYFSRSQKRFDLPSGSYSLGTVLGSGGYGESFQATHTQTNTVSVIKVIRLRETRIESDFINTIKECIINIMLEKESAEKVDGPFVPKFYEVCFDNLRLLMLVRMERLQGTMANIYKSSTPQQNDIIVPETVGDLAYILDFFYDRFKFNHRDLKSDNVMYSMAASGKLIVKLIDFGFSCITWNGLQISGAHYFPLKSVCYIPSRDLTQYIYDLLHTYNRRLSPRLSEVLQSIVNFSVGEKQYIFYTKESGPRISWDDVYDVLNNEKVLNPKGVPKEVYKRIFEFMGKAVPKRITSVPPMDRTGVPATPKCLPEQILNPKNHRCVERSSRLGMRLMVEPEIRTPSPNRIIRKTRRAQTPCDAKKKRDTITGRCVSACDKRRQIRNPTTRRCVSKKSKLGKELLGKGVGVF